METNFLKSGQGWNSTHLFGGIGAYPSWKSEQPVPPNVPVVFYVNGTRGRRPIIGDIEVIKQGATLHIKFEGTWHIIQLPF